MKSTLYELSSIMITMIVIIISTIDNRFVETFTTITTYDPENKNEFDENANRRNSKWFHDDGLNNLFDIIKINHQKRWPITSSSKLKHIDPYYWIENDDDPQTIQTLFGASYWNPKIEIGQKLSDSIYAYDDGLRYDYSGLIRDYSLEKHPQSPSLLSSIIQTKFRPSIQNYLEQLAIEKQHHYLNDIFRKQKYLQSSQQFLPFLYEKFSPTNQNDLLDTIDLKSLEQFRNTIASITSPLKDQFEEIGFFKRLSSSKNQKF
ncbi:Inosine-5'-monophosphate dehydrogenase 1 [Sarcoptes scabiei]|nr:Inosine-5'-monophosphate dehydrogenase 1 [Sarcoptes scabiei]